MAFRAYKIGVSALLAICIVGWAVLAGAVPDSSNNSTWSNPTVKTLRRIGPAPDTPHQPNYFSNLDCTTISYRTTNDATMRAGCFTVASYGLVETDSDMVIFNGTDETVSLYPFANGDVLLPWVQSSAVLALHNVTTGGSQVGMYKHLPYQLEDNRNVFGQVTSKQLKQASELQLSFSDNKPLIINPQTVAFSPNGSWMVAETLRGAFVRVNLASLEVVAFGPSYASTGSPALYKSSVSITNNGRYVAIGNNAAKQFIVYDLLGCSVPLVNGLSASCPHYDYWDFLHGAITELSSVQHVRFVGSDRLSFDAVQPGGRFKYVLAPQSSITSLVPYIALGDSYTSGEGAFDYMLGTDTNENMCHASTRAYPWLISNALFGAQAKSVACSGAVINDITPPTVTMYRGQIRNGTPYGSMSTDYIEQTLTNFTPGILAQNQYIERNLPDKITVSIGGNDIGFGQILATCVAPHISKNNTNQDCFSSFEDRLELQKRIDSTLPRWKAMITRIHSASPESTMFVIGYPQIASSEGKCSLNVHLSANEIKLSNIIVEYLNNKIRQAAVESDAHYIDITHALDGHRLCEARSYSTAVNGLTAGKDAGLFGFRVLGKESYHPNALGHELIAATILKATNRLNDSMVIPTHEVSLLGGSQPSGRQVADVGLTTRETTQNIYDKATPSNLNAEVGDELYGVSNTFIFHLDQSNGLVVGSGTLGGTIISGMLSFSVSTPSGIHTIHITGTNSIGKTIDIVHTVYIKENPKDADGDGIDDSGDSCKFAVNSGVDADNDGVDDACDNVSDTSTVVTSQVLTTASDPTEATTNPTTQFLKPKINKSDASKKAITSASNSTPNESVLGDSVKITQPRTVGWIKQPLIIIRWYHLLLSLLAASLLILLVYLLCRIVWRQMKQKLQ